MFWIYCSDLSNSSTFLPKAWKGVETLCTNITGSTRWLLVREPFRLGFSGKGYGAHRHLGGTRTLSGGKSGIFLINFGLFSKIFVIIITHSKSYRWQVQRPAVKIPVLLQATLFSFLSVKIPATMNCWSWTETDATSKSPNHPSVCCVGEVSRLAVSGEVSLVGFWNCWGLFAPSEVGSSWGQTFTQSHCGPKCPLFSDSKSAFWRFLIVSNDVGGSWPSNRFFSKIYGGKSKTTGNLFFFTIWCACLFNAIHLPQ